MENGALLSPEHLDRIKGWREYMASCDDPGLGKPPFVALKNSSRAGSSLSSVTSVSVRCVWGSKRRIDSTSSPKNSMRTGLRSSGGKTSRMSPRSEKVPTSSTSGLLR